MGRDVDDIIEILTWIKGTVDSETNVDWTGYQDTAELLAYLDKHIGDLREGRLDCLEALYGDFLPTLTFQELAISNGWMDYYLELARRFDEAYARIKSTSKNQSFQ